MSLGMSPGSTAAEPLSLDPIAVYGPQFERMAMVCGRTALSSHSSPLNVQCFGSDGAAPASHALRTPSTLLPSPSAHAVDDGALEDLHYFLIAKVRHTFILVLPQAAVHVQTRLSQDYVLLNPSPALHLPPEAVPTL